MANVGVLLLRTRATLSRVLAGPVAPAARSKRRGVDAIFGTRVVEDGSGCANSKLGGAPSVPSGFSLLDAMGRARPMDHHSKRACLWPNELPDNLTAPFQRARTRLAGEDRATAIPWTENVIDRRGAGEIFQRGRFRIDLYEGPRRYVDDDSTECLLRSRNRTVGARKLVGFDRECSCTSARLARVEGSAPSRGRSEIAATHSGRGNVSFRILTCDG